MATSADTRVARSAHPHNPDTTHSGTFDPADWLARYTALGGVYVANGKLNLCILVNEQTDEQLSDIRELVVSLTGDDKAAILAHLKTIEIGLAASRASGLVQNHADPISRYWTAFHAHNRGELDAAEYLAADKAMWAFTPTTPRDFIRKCEAVWAVDGKPTDDHQASLVRDAIALLGADARSVEA